MGLIYTFVRTALKLTSKKEDLNNELLTIHKLFRGNGYPETLLKKHIELASKKFQTPPPLQPRDVSQHATQRKYISYSYIQGNQSHINKLCHEKNITVGRAAGKKLKQYTNSYK